MTVFKSGQTIYMKAEVVRLLPACGSFVLEATIQGNTCKWGILKDMIPVWETIKGSVKTGDEIWIRGNVVQELADDTVAVVFEGFITFEAATKYLYKEMTDRAIAPEASFLLLCQDCSYHVPIGSLGQLRCELSDTTEVRNLRSECGRGYKKDTFIRLKGGTGKG